MKYTKYSKYVADLADEMSMEDLLSALSDYMLESGFQSDSMYFQQLDEHSLDALRQAIQQALEMGDFLDEEMRERLEQMQADGTMDELIERLIERMQQEELISVDQPHDPARQSTTPGQTGEAQTNARFEITDKSLDFLGFKTLRDLLGSLGRSSFGRHDTRDLATGIESSGASKPYEFGDTMNLDITETLSSAIQREGLHLPLNIEYSDLQVHQCEYQSSCATVVMLDCSHSMILYGEDRFTPAKKVAMALSHLIRTQYPGDSLSLVLFHDSAEEMPISQLARVKVGPYYTNTREGLRLAQRILQRQRKDMKQIVMITDGKPSALTLEDGRIYKNAFGLDPLVVSQTLEEVSRCKRAGIMINTFMLASDYGLVQFVQKVTAMCKGKAYFTT
ncbi:MAG TPA: VWA domain-containing protein, partial [Candidatus Angelobacter sp.]